MDTDRVAEPPAFLGLAGHPVRWRLLTELAGSDLRVRELVKRVEQPQNLVSYHLRLLRDSGLLRMRRSSYDARDTYYHLDVESCARALRSVGAALHPRLGMALSETVTPQPVLFVCTGNSARSPVAEALLRHHCGGRVAVASAGISPKARMHPYAVRVLRERYGIDISGQVPRSIKDVTGSVSDRAAGFGLVVTLCDKARENLPSRPEWRRTHWSVPDPADVKGAKGYATFASIVDDIDTRVQHLLPTLGEPRQREEEQ